MLDLTTAGLMIAGISAGMTLLSSLVRHAVLDKEKFREQKERIKHHQEEAKSAQKKKDMKAAQHHQKQMLEVSMEQMQSGFKPMLFTMIPFLIVFGWMSSNFGDIGALHNVTITAELPATEYNSAVAGHQGRVEGNVVSWNFSMLAVQEGGLVNLTVDYKRATSDIPSVSAEYTVHNGSKFSYRAKDQASTLMLDPSAPKIEGNKAEYIIVYTNSDPFKVATLFGYDLGWFGWYFVCSIVSGMIFNKLLGNT